MATLALLGGEPVRSKPWPKWPICRQTTVDAVSDALRSGRWTISGPAVAEAAREPEFARAFADYCGTRYCVPTANGSSALVIAFEALGIGFNDEVIVPVLTWVASASTILRVNATPIFVDVDPGNLCMSVAHARAAITAQTKAIVAVHLHHSMADVDAFVALSEETGIPLIEDASQAHGALWRGRRAGCFGRLGTFSFQQSKVLTCGEGGAVVTNDPVLYERLQQLRADSRRWTDTPQAIDGMQLIASDSSIMGANYCLSELQAAVLLEQLTCLDEQLTLRASNAEYLDQQLAKLPGISPLRQPAALKRRTVYEYLIRIDPQVLGHQSVERVCAALRAELGLRFYPPDPPLHCSPLYHPLTKPRFSHVLGRTPCSDSSEPRFPIAETASRNAVICHHAALLGSRQDMDDIVRAFEKVLLNICE